MGTTILPHRCTFRERKSTLAAVMHNPMDVEDVMKCGKMWRDVEMHIYTIQYM